MDHTWITDTDEDGFFEARCLRCGLIVLDAPVFDHEVYPLACQPEPGHRHLMMAAPSGAECHDCDLHIDYDWAEVFGPRPVLGLDLLCRVNGYHTTYTAKDHDRAGLPMIVACTYCGTTMAGAAALLDEQGHTWCAEHPPSIPLNLDAITQEPTATNGEDDHG